MNGAPNRPEDSAGREGQPPQQQRKSMVVRLFRALTRRKGRTRSRVKEQTPHQINESMMAGWTRRVGLFTGALALIGIVTAWILYETDQTSRQVQRAFLVANVDAVPFRDEKGSLDFWRIKLNIENVGNSTARDIRSKDMPFYDLKSVHPDPNEAEMRVISNADYTVTLGPRARTRIAEIVLTRSREELLISERKIFFLMVAKYRDIFDAEHITKACFEVVTGPWDSKGTPQDMTTLIDRFDLDTQMCRKNNCTDNDCPKEDR